MVYLLTKIGMCAIMKVLFAKSFIACMQITIYKESDIYVEVK